MTRRIQVQVQADVQHDITVVRRARFGKNNTTHRAVVLNFRFSPNVPLAFECQNK